MTYARKSLVSLSDTPYYHVVARCVRRAWLWGFDEYASRDYSHRKRWVLERLSELSAIFTIDICAYAVLSNHYHLVIYIDQKRTRRLTRADIVERWVRLYRAPPLIERWRSGSASDAEREAAEAIIENWRARLCDLSWLMKCLNEHLARRANAEDNCSGRFWEGRFRSQALLDEAGLLTAMAYVDLNPVRAGIAATPEDSEFTSIYERIRTALGPRSGEEEKGEGDAPPQVPLRPFRSSDDGRGSIPYRFEDYLALVDWTGRQIREDKRGHIDAHLPPIIQRLNIDHDAWCLAMRPRGNVFGRAMGKLNHLRLHASTLGQSWVKGVRTAERLYDARA